MSLTSRLMNFPPASSPTSSSRTISNRVFSTVAAAGRLLAVLLIGAGLPVAHAQSQSKVAARLTQPIQDSTLVTLRGNTHPLAKPAYDQGLVPVSLPARHMLLVLKRSPQQEADLKQFLAELQVPGSPNYHKFITPEQFGALYGPADADIQTVGAWLQGHGFSIDKVNKAKTVIEFSGNVGQIQDTFHTSIHSYLVGGEQHYANASDPQIPAALAPVVAGVAQMNNFNAKAHPRAGPRGTYDPSTGTFTTATLTPSLTLTGSHPFYLGPSDAATIYDSPMSGLNKNFSGGTNYNGAGVTIGIAGDANIDVSGVAAYRAFFGLPASTPNVIVDGDDPGVGDIYESDTGEALLDVEIAGGMAPGATINLYTSADNTLESGLFLAIYRALDDNAVGILNVSFGSCEGAQGTSGNASNSNAWEEAAAQGISVTVSTGDSGSANCDNPNLEDIAVGGLAVNGLASTPYNIAVGGTDFDVLLNSSSSYFGSSNSSPYFGTATKYIPENPWNDSTSTNTTISANTAFIDNNGDTNIVAAGGGASGCVELDSSGTICLAGYAKPSWQMLFDNGDQARDLPDVSMFASNGFYGASWAVCAVGTEGGAPVNDCQLPLSNATTINGFGGTSTAAPAFAGVLAIVSQKVGGRLGQANQVLYPLAKQTPSIFHDVTVGNNSVPCVSGSLDCGSNGFLTGYNAGASYDLATGLGSVDITGLVNGWSTIAFSPSNTALTLNGGATPLTISHGTAVTVGVKVTGTSGTPTGDVSVNTNLNVASNPNGGNVTAFTLGSGGSTSDSVNFLPGGTYNLTAYYEGDGTFAPSTSSPISVVVTPENSTMTFQLVAYDASTQTQIATNPIPYGSYTVLDVAPVGTKSSTDGNATGNIVFSGALSKTSNLNSEGFVELETTTLPPGTQTINAAYSGDSSFNPSTGSVAATISQGGTLTSASSSASSIAASGTLTLSAAIATDSAGNPPSGTVTFKAGSTTLGTAAVVTGSVNANTGLAAGAASASVAASTLATGANSITAVYSGDTNYAGSTSAAISVTVTGTSTTPGFTISGTSFTVAHGATTNNTSTVTVTPSGSYTGTVDLSCAVTASPAGAVDIPTCSITNAVIASGAASATATLTINSTASSALQYPAGSPFGWYTAGGTALACLAMFGIPARRRGWRGMLALLVFAGLVSFASGCGGGSSSGGGGGSTGTTTGVYTLTISGHDSAVTSETASTTITVTID